MQDVNWAEIDQLVAEDEAFCKQVLSFAPGKIGIVANSRVIGPFDEDEEFIPADFLLLERFAMKSSVEKVYNAMESKLGKYTKYCSTFYQRLPKCHRSVMARSEYKKKEFIL